MNLPIAFIATHCLVIFRNMFVAKSTRTEGKKGVGGNITGLLQLHNYKKKNLNVECLYLDYHWDPKMALTNGLPF